MNRLLWGLLCWLAGLSLSFNCWSSPDQATNRPPKAPAGFQRHPNVIFILADDLGYGDLGCYGQKKIKTPNLDRMAAEGMRFTSFYAGSTVCAPSRCALMTGLHTGHCLIRGNGNVPLRTEDLTVAEILKSAGFYTGLVGKWGLGKENTTGLPQKKGFDQFVGYLDQVHAHDYYTDHLWRHDPVTGFDGQNVIFENQGGKKGLYIHDLFTTGALNFVRIHKPDQFNRYQPLFLYLAYTIPHANNEETKRSGNGMEVPNDSPYTDEPWPQVEKNKAAMISRLDTDVGRLLAQLKKYKMDDDTIVFFSSDNGAHKEGGVDPKFFNSSGPLRGIKRDLYEGGIRVPLVVRWPGKVKAGTVNDIPFAFWDFLPTAADLAGTNAPPNSDGISFVPTLLGQTQTNQHQFLYWEFHERGFQQAARMGEWKAVRAKAGQPIELYNLTTDLGEKKNVAVEQPEIVAKFEDYFKTARTESADWPIKN
ncbi:MAG: N-acetylgalactosamine-6-sulfatase [Verrucomicrobia bacterium]|nr:MAG: N-acetylgalactosamine-6-sulfatase [Verrucomicrobiota bacterium]